MVADQDQEVQEIIYQIKNPLLLSKEGQKLLLIIQWKDMKENQKQEW